MKVIEEIRRQRAILGTAHADSVILSHSAFKQLLAEKDEFGLYQLDTQTIPPTIYGMSISIADEPEPEISVLAIAPCGDVAPLVIDGVWGCLLRRPPCRKIGDTIKRALD